MSIPEELLTAYVDGELDPAARARVEAAIAADPELARRMEKHEALRVRLGAVHADVLHEPVPERLLAAARSASTAPRAATVTDISRARADSRWRPTRPWVQRWAAIAAGVALVAFIGYQVLGTLDLSPITRRGGHLVAQRSLDRALSNLLASDQTADAPVRIGVSFKAKSGEYCRTFVLQDGDPLGGLACREGDEWRVRVLARAERAPAGNGDYRQAATEIPPAVRSAAEAQIAGEPLDGAAEAGARSRNWH